VKLTNTAEIIRPTDLTEPGALDALFAFHRSVFGDAVMELDEGEGEAESAEGTESTEGEGAEGAEGENTEGEGGEQPKPKPEDELPEWARSELKKVRGEAANYRTKFREASKQLEAAKTPEEYEAAVSELQEQIATMEQTALRNEVAADAKLPKAMWDRIKGSTREELVADAKALAALVVTEDDGGEPESLSGGLNPHSDDDGETDPRKLAQKYGPRRRR
jgi:hypothetical protein